MKANKNIFVRFSEYLDQIPNKLPEFIVLCLYASLLAFVAYFHEPWFDEAQSWLIARAASLKEMFFYIPHYEGHPPFWWLVLAPFAKAGLPYEITLKTINITLCSIGMGLFLFKSPFKRIIKFLVPFTFFMFYQYGVISRCYCLTIIAFMLVSITYQNRNIKPFAYVGSLMMLCATSAYGIVFSGGLAIVWLLEMFPFSLKDILQKRQFKALALLLAFALFLIYIIMPRPDTHAINLPTIENTFFTRFLILFIVVPINSIFGFYIFEFLKETTFRIDFLLKLICYSLPFVVGLYYILRGFKKRILFYVPYLLFALFSAIVYFNAWHRGFVFLFYIFIFWQIALEKTPFIYPKFFSEEEKIVSKKVFYISIIVALVFSISYTFDRSKYDVFNVYDNARATAQFIKENHLENRVIFAQWIYPNKRGQISIINPINIVSLKILPYFNNNIIKNLNFGDNKYPYSIHKVVNKEEYYKEWAKGPKPDIKLGDNFSLDMIWPDITKEEDDFVPVALEGKYILPVYLHRDLAKELTQMNIPKEKYFLDSVHLKVKKAYLADDNLLKIKNIQRNYLISKYGERRP